MISAVFFVWAFTTALLTLNALRGPVAPGRGYQPMWLPAMLVSELAPWLVLLRAMIGGLLIWLGGGEGVLGAVGWGLFAFSEIGAMVLVARTLASSKATGHRPPFTSLMRMTIKPVPGIEHLAGIEYAPGLTLDLSRLGSARNAPTLVYLHPGSWMRGGPGRQARPMLRELVGRGWVVLDIRYPLSPAATFPEHLIGVKRALEWARREGARYGIDPGKIAIAGASAGAHLAALAALASDRRDLQPGFEDADVSVMACVAFYGIYDLLVRNKTRNDWPFIAKYVLKTDRLTSPHLYELGSPIDQVRDDAPPFLVIHGAFDSVVLCEESRFFVAALQGAGAPVDYREIGGAQHGFDAFGSMRSRAVGSMAASWLSTIDEKARPPSSAWTHDRDREAETG